MLTLTGACALFASPTLECDDCHPVREVRLDFDFGIMTWQQLRAGVGQIWRFVGLRHLRSFDLRVAQWGLRRPTGEHEWHTDATRCVLLAGSGCQAQHCCQLCSVRQQRTSGRYVDGSAR